MDAKLTDMAPLIAESIPISGLIIAIPSHQRRHGSPSEEPPCSSTCAWNGTEIQNENRESIPLYQFKKFDHYASMIILDMTRR